MQWLQGHAALIDEAVNLYKIPNAITRQYNYEKILTMYNEHAPGQGAVPGHDHGRHANLHRRPPPRRVLLRGPGAADSLRAGFAREDLKDMLAPIIRLQPLTYEELLVLIEKLMQIHAGYFGWTPTLAENDLVDFLRLSSAAWEPIRT